MKRFAGIIAAVLSVLTVPMPPAVSQDTLRVQPDTAEPIHSFPREENPQSADDAVLPAAALPANEFVPPTCRIYTPALPWCRANGDWDAQGWITPYLLRSENVPEVSAEHRDLNSSGLPPEYAPWWTAHVGRRTGISPESFSVGLDALVNSALEHSSHLQAVTVEPQIRRTVLVEEQAQFDWRSFLNTTWDDLNDPVGNTLTTGNNSERYTVQRWSADGGLRRRSDSGGELELAQRLGTQRNNSVFLVPNPQATTRLELSYTHPLMNGSGPVYNQSRIVLARIDTHSAEDEVVEELQEHLFRVTEAYWELFRARAEFLQRGKVCQEAVNILSILTGRQELDVLERQVLRTRAAVASRRSQLARAVTSVRNAESQLRLLVNDPELLNAGGAELTPRDTPATSEVVVSMRDGLQTALLNRPDISRAIRSMRTTTTRLGVARNEILPKLDLIVSTYVAGLDANSAVFGAYGNQFAAGRPGYTAGVQFEVPLGNRAARARLERRQWEMIRATSQFRQTVEQSLTETEIAVREVETSRREMVGKYESMVAADNEKRYLVDRWQMLPGIDDSATLLLEDLLDSQERLADVETEFVRAQVSYSVALVRLKKAMGTLLRFDEPRAGMVPR